MSYNTMLPLEIISICDFSKSIIFNIVQKIHKITIKNKQTIKQNKTKSNKTDPETKTNKQKQKRTNKPTAKERKKKNHSTKQNKAKQKVKLVNVKTSMNVVNRSENNST